MNAIFKKALPDILAVVAFVLVSFFYFFPADTEGRVIRQGDNTEGNGSGVEMQEYYQRTGERTRWTNSQFGGMPTYQMAPSYDSTTFLGSLSRVYQLGLNTYVMYLFIYLLGFYILLRAFDFKAWMAALGAVLWAFSTYLLIIIGAGHIWKVMTLAYIPPTIAGMVLCYKGKYLWGGVLTAFFTALQIYANHVQMTYYFLFVVFFLWIAYGIDAWRKKQWPTFWKATATFAVAGLVGVCINLSNLFHTWQYAQESMRGKSELVKANTANQTNSGLERDYITQWSYGVGETWTLLVPNVRGGASVPISENATAMAKADYQLQGYYQQLGQYWGDQPGTSGPVYVGAFVLMLFLVGAFIVRGPLKWALLVSTVLSIFLSWGHNMMWFTNLFIDYMPMYAKFRTVASILVIAEFTIPLLAMLALKEIWNNPDILRKRYKIFIFGFAFTGGVSLLFALFPTLGSPEFISQQEMQMFQQAMQDPNYGSMMGSLIQNLTEMRKAILVSDAWRSFAVVLIGAALLYAYWKKWLGKYWMLAGVGVLCLVDLWGVNKRYLNDEMFVQPDAWKQTFQMTEADKQINKDKSDYRVANLAVNTFNETTTSYYHKSIGGYNAAKLRRYQEMIEEHIQPEMASFYRQLATAQGDMTKINPDSIRVLNMLNTKYFIMPLQNNQTMAVLNPYAYGNAWFVKQVQYVDNANQEIAALHKVSPKDVAVVDKKFKEQVPAKTAPQGSVRLTAYEPNKLTYEVQSGKGGVIVFSEIYYPGWEAFLDGKEVEIGRADYILRAVNVPAGKHQLVMTFDPKSLHETETVAYIAMAILLLTFAAGIFFSVRKHRKK